MPNFAVRESLYCLRTVVHVGKKYDNVLDIADFIYNMCFLKGNTGWKLCLGEQLVLSF